MFTKNLTRSAAIAAVAAALLSGCGDSDDKSTAQAPTSPAGTTAGESGTSPTPVAVSPAAAADPSVKVGKKEGRWAEQLCTAMVGRVSAIKPPQVDTSSPEGTLTSLRTFFADVVEEQGGQLKTLEEVGPPPGTKAAAEWKKAVSELRTVRTDVGKVADELKSTQASNAQQLQGVIAKLGKELQSLSSYGGPVSAMFANSTIGPALQREPACAKVS